MFGFIKYISEKFFLIFLIGSITLSIIVGFLWKKTKDVSEAKVVTDIKNLVQRKSPIVKLNANQIALLPPFSEEDHKRGNKGASVTLIVYSDYECPFCADYYFIIRKILDEYKQSLAASERGKDEMRLAYRHYPIVAIHPESQRLAETSECVTELGGDDAFWQFSDIIFTKSDKGKDLSWVSTDLNINQSKFNKCVEDSRYKEKVERQYDDGLKAGVSATPTTFIIKDKTEVWLITGAYSYEDMKVIIEEAFGGHKDSSTL